MQPRSKPTGYRLQATGRNHPSAPQASCLQSQPYLRRGISLLEVLISMFILLVGLLGVGALIPVGKLEVSQADQYDRTGAVGRAAFREIKVRGMLRADAGCLALSAGNTGPLPRWLNYNAYANAGTSLTNNGGGVQPNGSVLVQDASGIAYGDGLPVTSLMGGGGYNAPTAYCLDPWGLALNFNAGVSNPYVGTFPAAANGDVGAVNPATPPIGSSQLQYMTRITLLSPPTLSAAQLASGGAIGQLSNGGPMTLGMAEHIFHWEDDLSINVPGSNSGMSVINGNTYTMSGNVSPIQQFFPTGNVQKRLSDGNYSWMVTIVPNSPTLQPSGNKSEPFNNQQYTVSVVVFYKRPVLLNTQMNQSGQTAFYPERYATVKSFGGVLPNGMTGSAISGGDMLLVAPTPSAGHYDPSYLNVKRGQWILLAGQSKVYLDPSYGLNPPGALPPVWIYRWYRVVAADDITDSTSVLATPGSTNVPFQRNVTLVGPDWPAHLIAQNGVNPTTYAIICDGVVGVYEKTMPLERNSVWATQ